MTSPPLGTAEVVKANALDLPLADESVDLIVTSPPYFALRSYQDDGGHYDGQIGSEETPQQFLEALWAVMAECWRVLKPSGSAWVNLGDKYAGSGGNNQSGVGTKAQNAGPASYNKASDVRAKSLMGLPWSFALGCIGAYPFPQGMAAPDGAKWILRAEVIWDKPNGLPESVTDRVRRSHEQWFHMVKSPRYFSAVDAIREPLAEVVKASPKPLPLAPQLVGPPDTLATGGVGECHKCRRRVELFDLSNHVGANVFPQDEASSGPDQERSAGFAGTPIPLLVERDAEVAEDAATLGEDGGVAVVDDDPKMRASAAAMTQGDASLSVDNPRQPCTVRVCSKCHPLIVERKADPLGKLPGSVWRIATEPLKVPAELGIDHFACVDPGTEILSDRGWLTVDDLQPGDTVAGYDLDTGLAKWTTCHGVHRYDFDGEMVAVEKRDLSMRLTPNHRVLAQKANVYDKSREPVAIVRADELRASHFIPRSAEWMETPTTKTIGTDMAALLGWVAAEGWYSAGRCVYLSQSLTVNPQGVATIDALLPDAYRTERPRVWKGNPWMDVQWRLPTDKAAWLRDAMPEKQLPWWVTELVVEERRAVLAAFIDGDGHRRPDGRIGIFQKHKHNLDVLQAVAVTLGYKTTLRQQPEKWVLYLTTGGRSVTLRGTNGSGPPIPREHYKGEVWCPTTGTGTFIARRNGAVFVTGNSFPTEWPRRIILGWSPSGICSECGEGRRPVVEKAASGRREDPANWSEASAYFPSEGRAPITKTQFQREVTATITGEECQCGQLLNNVWTPRPTVTQRRALGTTATPKETGSVAAANETRTNTPGVTATEPPTRPAVVLDPFGGTGTTALVAKALGRHGISVDLSADYCRLAEWRTSDPQEIRDVQAKTYGIKRDAPKVAQGQIDLFGEAS